MDVDVAAVEFPRTIVSARRAEWFTGDVVRNVELGCVWKRFFVAVFVSQTGVLKLGMTDFFRVGELIPIPKAMDGMNEPMRARAMHTLVTNIWMNPNTEQEFCTAFVSQFCQALRGYNGMKAGQKLLESEEMDCRGAGVVQTILWALRSVVASKFLLRVKVQRYLEQKFNDSHSEKSRRGQTCNGSFEPRKSKRKRQRTCERQLQERRTAHVGLRMDNIHLEKQTHSSITPSRKAKGRDDLVHLLRRAHHTPNLQGGSDDMQKGTPKISGKSPSGKSIRLPCTSFKNVIGMFPNVHNSKL